MHCQTYLFDSDCYVVVFGLRDTGLRQAVGVERFSVIDAHEIGASVARALATDLLPVPADPQDVLAEMVTMSGASTETAFYKGAGCVFLALQPNDQGADEYKVTAAKRRGRGFTLYEDSPQVRLHVGDTSPHDLGVLVLNYLDKSRSLG